MVERLRRLEAVYDRHPIYFLAVCTADRRPLLASPIMHDAFGRFAQAAAERGAWVGRYVLMPDQMHLFVALEDHRIGVSDWVTSLKNWISKAFRTSEEPSPHWQKGFFDHVMRGSESYAQKWDYVRENPVRAGLVAQAEAWPYAGEIHDIEYGKDLLLSRRSARTGCAGTEMFRRSQTRRYKIRRFRRRDVFPRARAATADRDATKGRDHRP